MIAPIRALWVRTFKSQAVPLLRTDAPCVKTGIEKRAAIDSGAVIIARNTGVVKSVTSEKIRVQAQDGNVDEYDLLNMIRSNQATCITQKPIVKPGQRVR